MASFIGSQRNEAFQSAKNKLRWCLIAIVSEIIVILLMVVGVRSEGLFALGYILGFGMLFAIPYTFIAYWTMRKAKKAELSWVKY